MSWNIGRGLKTIHELHELHELHEIREGHVVLLRVFRVFVERFPPYLL